MSALSQQNISAEPVTNMMMAPVMKERQLCLGRRNSSGSISSSSKLSSVTVSRRCGLVSSHTG